MNYIDIIIAILVLLASIKGFSRGFIKELVSVVSLVLGIYLAVKFSGLVEEYLIENLKDYKEFVSIISFVIVFLIVFLSLKLAGIILSKITKALKLGLVNKLLGILFGAIKVLLFLGIILFETAHLEETLGEIIPKKQIKNSVLYQPTFNIIPVLIPKAKKKLKIIKTIEKKVKEGYDSITE